MLQGSAIVTGRKRMSTSEPPARLLFLCTGNYYRSRFAELLFNVLAQEAGLNWIAESRGLALERGTSNVGPISRHVLDGLAGRGLRIETRHRFPLQVQAQDLSMADMIVALCEGEHRPLMHERFADWSERVIYWEVKDVHFTMPQEALEVIEKQVRELIVALREK